MSRLYTREEIVEAFIDVFDVLEENLNVDIIDKEYYGSTGKFIEGVLDNIDIVNSLQEECQKNKKEALL